MRCPLLRGVDDGVFVDPEEIAATDPALEVLSFSHIRHLLPDLLAHVFDDHVIGSDVLHRIETPVVNSGSGKFDGLLPLLELIEPECVTFTVRSRQDLLLSGDVRYQASIVCSVGS